MTRNRGLPDRWLKYKNMGNRIAGTPFIAFKVPLDEKFFRLLRVSDRFTPGEVVDNNPAIRLIIDLTHTKRYYTPECIESRGVNYYKLPIPGHVVPTEDLVSRFCDVVHDFLSGCTNGQDALIGVHCTHGVNRTGYLICSFMVRHLLMNPSEAISAFELARGHRIERQAYVEALMTLYSKSGSGRKRRVPQHGPPPTVSDAIPDDAEGNSVQRYGFGTLPIAAPPSSTGSWTISGPSHIRWNSEDDVRVEATCGGSGPDPEAGPSRKRGPNESIAPIRGHRKGKKDKRTKRNNGQSTSGTEGDDVRSDSSYGMRASGSNREEPAHDNRGQYHQREDPAYGCPSEKNNSWRSSLHLAPPPLQPRHPPPPFPSSQPYAAERGFRHRVERDSGARPAAPRRGDGGNGGTDGRGRGRDRGRGHHPGRGRGRGGGSSWDRAGGRGQGEQFRQESGRGWRHGRQWNTHHHRRQHCSYSQDHE